MKQESFETFFHFQRIENDKIDQLPQGSTLIAIWENDIDFMDNGKTLFKLNLRGFKKY
jgi:U3 small nucleolar ribonucleoprotein protein IMP4